jgi:hypothetical protein
VRFQEEDMKKWLLLLVTILGLTSLASAQISSPFASPQDAASFAVTQQLNIKAGANLSFGSEIALGANLGIRTPSFFRFSKTLGVGVRIDARATFGAAISGFATLSPVLNLSLDKDSLIYLGPTVGLALSGSDPIVLLGADLGFSYAISPFFGVYGDGKFIVYPVFFAAFDLGANYNLSQELSVYLEFQGGINPLGFSPGVGLGLFIHL